MDDLRTPHDGAPRAGVTPATVRTWADRNDLTATTAIACLEAIAEAGTNRTARSCGKDPTDAA